MDWLVVVILGIIEGITEFLFLPRHLLMAQAFTFMNFTATQLEMFNVVIQSGAVLAVIVVFYDRCRELLMEWRKPEVRDYLLKLVVAFVITGVGGIALKKLGMRLPDEAAPVAWATFIGGFVILGVEYGVRNKLKDTLSWYVVIAFGVAQLIAAAFRSIPERNDILLALAMGCNRKTAVEFSFILGYRHWFRPAGWNCRVFDGGRHGSTLGVADGGISGFGADGVCGGQVAAEVCAVA